MEERNGLYYIKNATLLPPPKPTVKAIYTIEPITEELTSDNGYTIISLPNDNVPVEETEDDHTKTAVPILPNGEEEKFQQKKSNQRQILVETVGEDNEDSADSKDGPSDVTNADYTQHLDKQDPILMEPATTTTTTNSQPTHQHAIRYHHCQLTATSQANTGHAQERIFHHHNTPVGSAPRAGRPT
jgi:hypothetical protein